MGFFGDYMRGGPLAFDMKLMSYTPTQKYFVKPVLGVDMKALGNQMQDEGWWNVFGKMAQGQPVEGLSGISEALVHGAAGMVNGMGGMGAASGSGYGGSALRRPIGGGM